MKNKQLDALNDALQGQLCSEQLRRNEGLDHYTTFKIGGMADLFISPRTTEELCTVMATMARFGLTPTILGGGSNVLVLDGGIRGVTLSLQEMNRLLREEDSVVTAAAGVPLAEVSRFAGMKSLTGLEFAVGIPGTLGGAVFMNAGAYGGEMGMVVRKVRTVTREGALREYACDECQFAYRHSLFQDNGEVVAEVDIALTPGTYSDIQATMTDLTNKRESKQPLEWPSAGSTFKRPTGYFAGTLIDQTGLKGLSVGDAQISEKHAGFVINRGHAKAKDVLSLICKVQQRIEDVHGIHLEREVRLMGEDGEK